MAGKIACNMEFGLPIFEIEIPDFAQHKQALIDEFLAQRSRDGNVEKSNQGGWHSPETLFKSEHASVVWLVRKLFEASVAGVQQTGMHPADEQMVMSGCWVNINESGDWNAPHLHLPDVWSGVFYVDVNRADTSARKGENDGDIIFINPMPLGNKLGRPATKPMRPENGKLFVFPSYLLHMVAPHFDEKPRISVAFNMKFRAK